MQNIKQQFLNSLKRGTGEAYLIVKDNPKINFSNEIIRGALNLYAYDGQCEGNRAHYIFDIISISNHKEKIRKAILQGLAREQENTWNLTHMFALTKLFAQQNDMEAKKAIYDRFLNPLIEGSDWVGYLEILELDGLDGLFYIAEKFGKYLEKNPDDWQDDSIIREFQLKNKHLKAKEQLQQKAQTNSFIRMYLDAIEQTKKGQEKNRRQPKKYKDVIDEVLNTQSTLAFKRKRNLTDIEVHQIARELMKATDTLKIEKLLDIFDAYKFPYDSQIILDFATQKRTGKNKIVENAIDALKHLKSEDIRNFAIDKMQNPKKMIAYLEILVSNYKSGDFRLLSEIAEKTKSKDKIEQLTKTYINIYQANPTQECKQPLEILYAKTNCAICRNTIVKILIKNKVLSDTIKNEIQFDCNLQTRKLIK